MCLYIPQQQLYLLWNKQKKNGVVGMCSDDHRVDGNKSENVYANNKRQYHSVARAV